MATKVKSNKQYDDVFSDKQYEVSGREIKENDRYITNLKNELSLVGELYNNAIYDLEMERKKNGVESALYQKLLAKTKELDHQVKQQKKDEETRKKINMSQNIRETFKFDREKAKKKAEERYEKEGKKEIEEYKKQREMELENLI